MNTTQALAESVGGWHFVLMQRRKTPQESHAQWASRVLGKPVENIEHCSPEEFEALTQDLHNAEGF